MSKMAKSENHEIPPIRVGILPIEGFALMSYAALVEPLRAANLLARRDLYQVINLGLTGGPVQSSGSANVVPDLDLKTHPNLDYLFVVAGGDPAAFKNRAVKTWLARMARGGAVLGGVSGGPVILALAGLMEGRRMTVHWEHAPVLAELSPGLLIERTLYVIDRDRMTCAGGTAPMDMVLALITDHHGVDFARLVSDWYMHTEIRPAIGPQRGGLVERVGVTTPAILHAVEAMEDNLAEPLVLQRLSDRAGVSERQLNRLFREKMGRSTMGYYRDLRLDKAQSLLRNSALSLTDIALATGFASSSHFSRAYSDKYGYPPSAIR